MTTEAVQTRHRPAAAPPHTPLEDVLGLATGAFLASLGIHFLQLAGAVTGGTAGLSLLTAYWTAVPFGVLFVAINVPFFALAVLKKGWPFTLRSLGCVAAVSALTEVHPRLLGIEHVEASYAVVGGNLLAGVGLLILFRHGASLGGFNILALILQERVGWRAGYVQMALDVLVILAALAVVAPPAVAMSALGAVVLNVVLAFNHRPGRYLGM